MITLSVPFKMLSLTMKQSMPSYSEMAAGQGMYPSADVLLNELLHLIRPKAFLDKLPVLPKNLRRRKEIMDSGTLIHINIIINSTAN